MPFRPNVFEIISIDGKEYRFNPHPANTKTAYAITGKRATIYQLQDEQGALFALKVFSLAYRFPQIAAQAKQLAPLQSIPGLEACSRRVLIPVEQAELVITHPELRYAVLMPWLPGRTLEELLATRNALTPEQGLMAAQKLAETLAKLEARGVVHGNLNPANVLVDLSAPNEVAIHLVGLEGMRFDATSDRFDGAMLLAELLSGEVVREDVASQEDVAEIIEDRWGRAICDVYERAVSSPTPAHCPPFSEWADALAKFANSQVNKMTGPGKNKLSQYKEESQRDSMAFGSKEGEKLFLGDEQDEFERNPSESLIKEKRKKKPVLIILCLAGLIGIITFIILQKLPQTSTPSNVNGVEMGNVSPMQENTSTTSIEVHKTNTPTTAPTPTPTTVVESPSFTNVFNYPTEKITISNASRVSQLARIGNGTINEIAYSPDGKTIAVASSIGIFLYNSRNLEMQSYFAEDNLILSLAFSPDGKVLASGSNDGTIRLWQVADCSLLRTLKGYASVVMSVAFSPNGQVLASGSVDNTIRLWQVADGSLLRTLEGHTSNVESVAFSPNGQVLASGSDDGTIRLWQVADGSLLRTLEGHTDWVSSVAFSPDGQVLASGSWDNTIRLWQVADGSLLRTLEGHTYYVMSVAFSPDGQVLASGSWETISLWRIADGSLLQTLEGYTSYVNSVAFSPDGQVLASGSDDSTVRLWRVADGSLLHTLKGHTDWVSSVAFSPDGQVLASGSADGTVRLWRIANGSLLRTFEGHIYWVSSVAFSPDGQILASGSADGTVRLWRVADGRWLRTLEGHTSNVESVAFSPDGQVLASGSADGTVRLWGIP